MKRKYTTDEILARNYKSTKRTELQQALFEFVVEDLREKKKLEAEFIGNLKSKGINLCGK